MADIVHAQGTGNLEIFDDAYSITTVCKIIDSTAPWYTVASVLEPQQRVTLYLTMAEIISYSTPLSVVVKLMEEHHRVHGTYDIV